MQLFKKKKTNKKLKEKISIEQNEHQMSIKGKLNNPIYIVRKLCFVSRDSENVIHIDSSLNSNEFQFNFSINDYPNLYHLEEEIFDLYLMLNLYNENLSEQKVLRIQEKADLKIDENGKEYMEYPIRLGRFQESIFSRFDIITVEQNECVFYKTQKGNISFAVNHELKPSTKTQINHFVFKRNMMLIDGKVFTRNSIIDSCNLILKGRGNGEETKAPIQYEWLKKDTEEKYGLNRYTYKSNINLNQTFSQEHLTEDIYDIYLEFQYHDIPYPIRVRLGRPRFRARFNIKSSFAKIKNGIFAISPYYTIKYKNLSLQVDAFESDTYHYLKRIVKWYWLIRPFYRKKNIWLVGERPYKAQDTGYRFFKFMRENYPDKNVFYIIEKDSPELKNVEEFGNVVIYKSKKHILYTLMARRIIGSHHPDYLYPLRTDEFKRKVKGLKVFLQHGVMGTKNTVHFYGKSSKSFDTNLFIVSSDFEKSMIVNDFGYHPRDVSVTGLSRFDSLFKDDVANKRQLLIIPTWREWLVDDEKFLESEYFERYKLLVNDPALHDLAQRHQFEIIFCLHPNMQRFSHYFKDSPIRVITQGEVDVQDLLKESAMMITDYSSVAFDFSFLNKPILYYQFDRARYIGKKGSHLNLDMDLPGDIVYEEEEILSSVAYYAQNNFKMRNENLMRASKFLKYKDLNSSERIYQAIVQMVGKSYVDKLRDNEAVQLIFKRWRKSKFYFPIMKIYYRAAKKLVKVDPNLIIFESGLGKQYSDSPRYIYEEILKRDLNYKKVWIYNKKRRFEDTNTIYVKRLSPRYYYYLAKARYWVNNQNFPTYIKKRPATTYLQTWHGTPLKKMLYDIEEVHGRSDDYVERVGGAVKNWDYLVSPSDYATKAFKSAFHYEGEILEVGYPRNDIFYSDDRFKISQDVRNKLGISIDKKIILYAPTFRDDQTSKSNKFSFDLHMNLNEMKERLGEDYVILLRMHVVVSSKIKIEEELRDFVRNVSGYPDIQELLLISDILITDYSSVMFDYANTSNPILFFTYDFEHYRDNLRGFYMDFEQEAPGPLVYNTEEIIKNIQDIERIKEIYHDKYKAFQKKYCLLEDGNATERVVDKVFDDNND